ncbi:hypothetical protein KDX39_10455 [Pseudomonas sp. CDFA 610]|nr:hypothetical protein [Pseudomonas sp. CDFA 610]
MEIAPGAVSILFETSEIDDAETCLQDDQRIGLSMNTPDDAEDVAGVKHQKASMRLAGHCDPMNQAASNVTAIAGH